MRILWTHNMPWGNETFEDEDGKRYRRTRPREDAHTQVATDFGPIELRKLSRHELYDLEARIIANTHRRKRGKAS